MGAKPGNDAHLTLISTDVSAYVTAIHMNLKGHGLVDVTAMGAAGHTWASDELLDETFTVDFLFESVVASLWDVLVALRGSGAAQACIIGPIGTTPAVDIPKITGNVWMEDLPMEIVIGDMIRLTGVPFRFSNGATVDTY